LYIGVDRLFGDWAGSFFAKFLAAPIGLVVSLFFFLVYDHVWPKQSNQGSNGKEHDTGEP